MLAPVDLLMVEDDPN